MSTKTVEDIIGGIARTTIMNHIMRLPKNEDAADNFPTSSSSGYCQNSKPLNLTANKTAKYLKVFPGGIEFQNEQEAAKHMKVVTVTTWKKDRKNTRTLNIEVNENLAADVVSIFNEILNSPERFPIYILGGYRWRLKAGGNGLSEHSFGTCIDINSNENYFLNSKGQKVGSFWLPNSNIYSIPPKGSVVTIFKKYGWSWGGNWKDPLDYMHFTYLGK